MKKTVFLFFLIFLAAAAFTGYYYYRNYYQWAYTQIKNVYYPCQEPITYSIDKFDPRFGISETDFLRAISDAKEIWIKAINRNLFVQAASGTLKINLVYDARQDATLKLQKLGLVVNDSKASYDSLKAKYDSLNAELKNEKATIDSRVAAFDARKAKYEADIAYWNTQGGAPKKEFDLLNAERDALNSEVQNLKLLQTAYNTKIENINALAVILNQQIDKLNLSVAKYNQVGDKVSTDLGSEFTEGTYKGGPGLSEIDIYQFDNYDKLVRVLAHELGHALGLEHVDDPKAIMYRLNEGTNDKLTAADLAVLKNKCGIQ